MVGNQEKESKRISINKKHREYYAKTKGQWHKKYQKKHRISRLEKQLCRYYQYYRAEKGIKRSNIKYSEFEDNILRKYYGKIYNKELIEKYLPKRDYDNMLRRAKRLKLKSKLRDIEPARKSLIERNKALKGKSWLERFGKDKLSIIKQRLNSKSTGKNRYWTIEEEQILDENKHLNINEIRAKFFPYRNRNSILKRRLKMGFRIPKDIWTENQIKQLNMEYGIKDTSKLSIELNKKIYSVYQKAKKLGFHSSNIGKHHTSETKQRLSIIHKERLKNKENHPMYRKKHSKKALKKMSDKRKEWFNNSENYDKFVKYQRENPAWLGKKHTLETKEKIRKANIGKIVSKETCRLISLHHDGMDGKKHSEETKKKIGDAHRGKFVSLKTKLKLRKLIRWWQFGDNNVMQRKEVRQEISRQGKLRWKDKIFKSTQLMKMRKNLRIKPNNMEKIVSKICKLNGLRFKYTGHWKVCIDGFNPDFIDKNNKKIIEFNGEYWHKDINKDKRKLKAYKTNGFDTLVIWQKELLSNPQKVTEKMVNFAI